MVSVSAQHYAKLVEIGCRSDWQAGNITWLGMPNLAPLPSGTVIKSIGANFVNWLGTSPQPQVKLAHKHVRCPVHEVSCLLDVAEYSAECCHWR